MDRIIKILIDLLLSKGLELTSIPAFIRNLANTLAADPNMSLEELNKHIHLLGWDDFDLDLCTLQLVLATFDSDASSQGMQRAGSGAISLRFRDVPDAGDPSLSFGIDHSKVLRID